MYHCDICGKVINSDEVNTIECNEYLDCEYLCDTCYHRYIDFTDLEIDFILYHSPFDVIN